MVTNQQLIEIIKSAALKAITAVRELDTALDSLKQTTKMTSRELNDLYLSANDTAKRMGVTTRAVIEQAAAWSELGFSTAESAARMAELSAQFQLLSPGMTQEEAISSLLATMKAYGMEAGDVLDGILSKVNAAGNSFAVSNADIAAMLLDSVSAMAGAGNTLDETIALITAAFQITRDRNAADGLQAAALRLRGLNEETQELDSSLATVRRDLYELTGVSVMKDADTYKSTCQILREISSVWDSLSEKSQAGALVLMFGESGADTGASVLENFSAAENAMDAMADSAGNANAGISAAMDSIDHKINTIKETGTGIAQNLFPREDIKSVLDMISSLGNGLDWLTEKLGLPGTAGLGAGIFAGARNIGKRRMSVRIS